VKRSLPLFLLIILLFGFIYATTVLSAPSSTLRVSFINVGQGDAALIQDHNGFDILIDGGLKGAGPTVVAYLREQGIDELEVMVASHADSDHIGGLIKVLEAEDIAVQRVFYNGYTGKTTAWFTFETAVANEAVILEPAQFPDTYIWGETSVQILNPERGLEEPETNDASVVLVLEYGVNRFLFTGDINSTIEATVVARGLPSDVQVLKVAHHGSDFSSGELFLQSARPQQAVISVGENNTYGHPGLATLERLDNIGAIIWRTDLSGNIIIASDGKDYAVFPQFIYEKLFIPLLAARWPILETPLPSVEPPLLDFPLIITEVFYKGVESRQADEYVQFENISQQSVRLHGWSLTDEAGAVYLFPDDSMDPGKICRVYTNQIHWDWCGFSYERGVAIWNDDGDCAYLKDADNRLVSQFCYGSKANP
jgi:competence protein ComEC